jgi:hypothetical protein
MDTYPEFNVLNENIDALIDSTNQGYLFKNQLSKLKNPNTLEAQILDVKYRIQNEVGFINSNNISLFNQQLRVNDNPNNQRLKDVLHSRKVNLITSKITLGEKQKELDKLEQQLHPEPTKYKVTPTEQITKQYSELVLQQQNLFKNALNLDIEPNKIIYFQKIEDDFTKLLQENPTLGESKLEQMRHNYLENIYQTYKLDRL